MWALWELIHLQYNWMRGIAFTASVGCDLWVPPGAACIVHQMAVKFKVLVLSVKRDVDASLTVEVP